MLLATLLATLALTPTDVPLRANHFSARLIDAPAFVQPPLQGSIGRGVNQVVSGSILTFIGGAILGFGVFGLVTAGNQVDEKAGLAWTVVGWTFFGIGAVVALVGIPILIVGIVRLATRNYTTALHVSKEGNLAVSF
jgi:hypothetical protein